MSESEGLTKKQLDASSSKLITSNQMIDALKTNLDLVKAQNEQLQHENTIIRSALDTTAAGKEKTLSLIDEKERAMKKQMQQLKFNQKQNAELKKEVTNRKNAFNALSKRYQNIKGDIFSLEQTLDQSNNQLVSKNKELKRLKSKTAEQAQKIETLKGDYDALKASLRSAVQPISPSNVKTTSPISSKTITAKPKQESNASEAKSTEQKPKVAPLTSSDGNTLDVPGEIILDLD